MPGSSHCTRLPESSSLLRPNRLATGWCAACSGPTRRRWQTGVDVTSAPNTAPQTQLGVSDRRTQGYLLHRPAPPLGGRLQQRALVRLHGSQAPPGPETLPFAAIGAARMLSASSHRLSGVELRPASTNPPFASTQPVEPSLESFGGEHEPPGAAGKNRMPAPQ